MQEKDFQQTARPVLRIIYWLAVAAAGGDLTAQSFAVEGILLRESYSHNKKDEIMATNEISMVSYQVRRHDCAWSIKTKIIKLVLDGEEFARLGEVEYEVQHDGTNIYEIYTAKTKGNKLGEAEKNNNTVDNVADVYMSPFPKGNANRASVIYLAYASTCFLRTNGQGKIKPFGFLDDRLFTNINYYVDARWENHDQYPFMIQKLVWYSDGTYHILTKNNQLVRKKYNSIYASGYKKGEYMAKSFTNLSGIYIPTSFELNIYDPSATGTTVNDLKRTERYVGTAQSVRPLEGGTENVVVKPPGDVLVFDKRFKKISRPLIYYTTNHWPVNDVKLRRSLYALQMHQDLAAQQPNTRPKMFLIAMFLILFCCPLIFWWWMARSKAVKNKHNQHEIK